MHRTPSLASDLLQPRPGRLLAALALLAAVAPAALPAQEGGDASPTSGKRFHRLRPASSEIVIDGHLDEVAWQQAVVIPLAFETRPGENVPPPVETQCLLAYDSSHFYVAFRAFDPDPGAIRAHLSDRDDAFDDDFVGVVLDPFNDERRAFEFFVNPLGVQMDMFQDGIKGEEDASWDAIWHSAGRITEEGYVVEMALPFSSLRFPAGQEEQTWGLDALRFYPRIHRHRISSQPLDRNVSCYLCQTTKITGIAGISPGRNLEITPTLTAHRTDRREDFPQGGFSAGSVDSEPGVTARWGMTPNLTLSATLNPDFSQVEADVAQLDVNEQFALFFPEKRPFFLEGADFFDTRLNAVFTRTVADPAWGLKLTGKAGHHGIGAFAAQDEVTNLILPGSQGSRSTSLDLETTDAVLRYRRDFGGSSALGVLLTSRQGDGYSNSVAGFDGLYRFTDSDSLRFQLLTSRSEYPDAVVTEFDQPAGAFDDWAGTVSYGRNSRDWDVWATYEDVGRDFRADLGFMPRVDYRYLVGGAKRKWWGEEDDGYTQIQLGGEWDLREDQDGNLLGRELEVFFDLGGPRQSWLSIWGGQRDRTFAGVTFEESFLGTWTEIRPTGDLYLSLLARWADQIDFANVRLGEILVIEPTMSYNLGLRTRLKLSHSHQRLDVEGGRLFTADLTQLRLIYQLNLKTFVRLVSQYTDIERDPELYTEVVEAKTERLLNQLLFSYKLNPQTVLFLGYSDSSLGDQSVDLTRADRTLFLKVGYAWVM